MRLLQTGLLLTALCCLLRPTSLHAAELDHSGVDWVRPFATAMQQAKDSQRLLLIKPIAFGTNKNGCW